ncbi:hypothetical protein GX441_09055 [bacterium]|nr:hypothetical protein [bacterium]
MGKHKALILAAVIAVLATATTAQAYYETWDGWFVGGTLYYSGNAYTTPNVYTREMYDSTRVSDRDTFYNPAFGQGDTITIRFVYDRDNDTIFLKIASITGGKTTGQTGTKEGDGTWAGSAIRRKNTVETTWSSVIGTWDASFTYPAGSPPPTPYYTGGWTITSSTPSGLTGDGACDGDRTANW